LLEVLPDFGYSLEEFVHLIVPAIARLIDVSEDAASLHLVLATAASAPPTSIDTITLSRELIYGGGSSGYVGAGGAQEDNFMLHNDTGGHSTSSDSFELANVLEGLADPSDAGLLGISFVLPGALAQSTAVAVAAAANGSACATSSNTDGSGGGSGYGGTNSTSSRLPGGLIGSLALRRASLDCLARLADQLGLDDHAGRIVHPVCRLLNLLATCAGASAASPASVSLASGRRSGTNVGGQTDTADGHQPLKSESSTVGGTTAISDGQPISTSITAISAGTSGASAIGSSIGSNAGVVAGVPSGPAVLASLGSLASLSEAAVQSLARLQGPALELLTILLCRMGQRFKLFLPVVQKTLSRLTVPQKRFYAVLSRVCTLSSVHFLNKPQQFGFCCLGGVFCALALIIS
ncbi:unnamed protein product, partial [Protopolystoma xenopodis]